MTTIHSALEILLYLSSLPLLGSAIYAVLKDESRPLLITSVISLTLNILVQYTR